MKKRKMGFTDLELTTIGLAPGRLGVETGSGVGAHRMTGIL